eukprot:gene19762-biopygen40139
MLDKGIPPEMARWFRAFLTQRHARVRVGDLTSGLREFCEGFPQGTILGPLCWDIFVDDLIDRLKLAGGVAVELYADDVVVLLRGKSLAEITRRAQRVLDELAGWEVENRAKVSLEKTTCTVFTPKPASVGCPVLPAQRPRLYYPDRSRADSERPAGPAGGRPGGRIAIRYDPNPKLLGIIFDETLCFVKQTESMKEKMASRRNILGRLSGTKWGQDTATLRALHLAYVQSRLDYGLAAWGPLLPPTSVSKLQSEQYQAACKVSGCARGSDTRAVLSEAHLSSVEQRIDFAAAAALERYTRLPAGNG